MFELSLIKKPNAIGIFIKGTITPYRWTDYNLVFICCDETKDIEELEVHFKTDVYPVENLDYVARLAGSKTTLSQQKNPPMRADLTHEEFIEFIKDEMGFTLQADHMCAALSSGARGKLKPTELLEFLKTNKKFTYRHGPDPRGGSRIWNFNDIDRRSAIRLLEAFFLICID